MSCVAELNAISQKKASVQRNIPGPESRARRPASAAPITSCMAQIQRRRVPSRSTTGDHSGLITHGR